MRWARSAPARLAYRTLEAVNRRRARRAPAPDTGTVRILLLHAYGMGGTIRTVFNLAGYLARTRDVEIVSAVRTNEEPFFPLPPGVRVSFLDDRTVPPGRLAKLLSRYPSRLVPEQENAYRTFTLYTDLRLVRYLRSLRTGVVIATRPAFALNVALFAPPEVITIAQEHVTLESHAPEMQARMKRRYGRLDAFVTLTRADLRQYKQMLKRARPAHLLRIPNAVPPLAGDVSTLEEKVAIAIGRVVHAKGFDRLVNAWKQVAVEHPDWVLRIYGAGTPEREERLRTRIADAGLSDRILLMGSTPDVGLALAQSSIYLVGSRYEGFGMTILEAMSKGVPVVSFDCPHGPREIITHESDGLLVRSKRAAVFGEAVLRVIEDAELRAKMGENAVRTAAQYDLDEIGAQWDALLEEVTATRLAARG
ncbi:glycosyl transferase [Microtetraspora sp. NBRC 13810]|nr:glycosyl transferase [Microtetraspora sp. NBRC 13810]